MKFVLILLKNKPKNHQFQVFSNSFTKIIQIDDRSRQVLSYAPAEWIVRSAASFIELPEKFDIMQTQTVNGRAKCTQHEIQGVDEQRDDHTHQDVADKTSDIVGYFGEID